MGQSKSRLQRVKERAQQCDGASSLHQLLAAEKIDVNEQITVLHGETVTCRLSGTPLWFAAKYSDVELAKLLLTAGARINLTSGSLHLTPLHMAAYHGCEPMVKLLLQHGAKVDVLDKWNYSPLMYVALGVEPSTVLSLFTLFIAAGCDVNFGATLDSQGRVHNTCSTELQPQLHGEDGAAHVTHVKEPMGVVSGTALHLVAQNPHLNNSCMQLLLEAGADVNARNLHGQTPLMRSFLDTYYDYHSNIRAHAQLLVSLGTNLESRDVRGWTCFHYAAQRGSIACMQLLLENGANCNVLADPKLGHVYDQNDDDVKSCDNDDNGDSTKGADVDSDDLQLSLNSRVAMDALKDARLSPIWLLLVHGWREASRYLLLNGCDLNTPLSSCAILRVNQNVDVCRYGDMLPVEFVLCNKYYSLATLMVKNGCIIDDSQLTGLNNQDVGATRFVAFLRQFRERKKQLQGLRELCKGVVRAHMRQGILVKCPQLGLPSVLCDFISNTEGYTEAWTGLECTRL